MIMNRNVYLLPGGYVDESGTIHREVEISPLGGYEEELLANTQINESASLVSIILTRCLRRVGTIKQISKQLIQNLLVADRQYLLLKLREETFGDKINANIFCPWPDCGKKISIKFSTHNIPVKESEEKGPVFNMKLSPAAAFKGDNGEMHADISFRLPNGEDQKVISPLVSENESKALVLLLGRCIKAIGPLQNPGRDLINKLSPIARLEIEKKMETVAPKVELTMEAACPECSHEFAVPFDIQDFFFGELRTSLDLLYREIHYLAYHYHWSERELMVMPREKRRRYIDVLADEIERMNNAVG